MSEVLQFLFHISMSGIHSVLLEYLFKQMATHEMMTFRHNKEHEKQANKSPGHWEYEHTEARTLTRLRFRVCVCVCVFVVIASTCAIAHAC